MAAITLGWRWPTLATLMPPIRSIYSLPATSYNVQQSAFTISSVSGDGEVWATWRRKSSRCVNTKYLTQRTQRWRKGAKKFSNLQSSWRNDLTQRERDKYKSYTEQLLCVTQNPLYLCVEIAQQNYCS